jgi:hypothetical protein
MVMGTRTRSKCGLFEGPSWDTEGPFFCGDTGWCAFLSARGMSLFCDVALGVPLDQLFAYGVNGCGGLSMKRAVVSAAG